MCAGVATGKAWRWIEPLHSTRADVEKLLGPSIYGYDLENERVFFSYQNITVYSKEKTPFEKLRLDRT
jgi:hypothetical protein